MAVSPRRPCNSPNKMSHRRMASCGEAPARKGAARSTVGMCGGNTVDGHGGVEYHRDVKLLDS